MTTAGKDNAETALWTQVRERRSPSSLWEGLAALEDEARSRQSPSEGSKESSRLIAFWQPMVVTTNGDEWDHETFMQRALEDRFPADIEAEIERGWRR